MPYSCQQSALLRRMKVRDGLRRERGGIRARPLHTDEMGIDPIAARQQLGDAQHAALLTRGFGHDEQLAGRIVRRQGGLQEIEGAGTPATMLSMSTHSIPSGAYLFFSRSLSCGGRSAVLLCSAAVSDAAAECVGGPSRRLLHFGGSLAGKLSSDALSTSSRGVSGRALG